MNTVNTSSNQDILTEVWEAKDRLSSAFGHDLKATCGALYAEQQRHSSDFINLGSVPQQKKSLLQTVKVISVNEDAKRGRR